MSGKDERTIPEKPHCPICGSNVDILLNHGDDWEAGWILRDDDAKTFDTTILLNDDYNPDASIVTCECETCGLLDIEFAVIAYRYFKRQVEAGNYITWTRFIEVRGF